MKHPIVVGLQYGDEGKGKITDILAKQADWVIRFNGGNNAGHTLWYNGKKLVTHSVPSGVLYSHVKNYIGAGCVVDPVALTKELEELVLAGAALDATRLRIDYRAHVILPLHIALDSAREVGPHGIGTTKRGIGPTYTTKMDRFGLRVCEVVDGTAKEKVHSLCQHYNALLRASGIEESSAAANLKVLEGAAELFRKHVSQDAAPFYQASRTQKCVLEGAQGILLDLDHGTYPFVTSSNTLPAYAAVGTPFPMSRLGAVIGVAKAYLTRVGQGPFETELLDQTGERLRHKGKEFGATTGRPRRVGWLNLDELKTAVQLSDCSGIVLTKSDILSDEHRIYAQMNKKLEAFEGWKAVVDASGKLSPTFETYVNAIEAFVGVPVMAVGTGPDRAELFWRQEVKDFWADVEGPGEAKCF